MLDFLSPSLASLLQVILIDVVLAGDNAVVIGMAAGRLPDGERKRAIFWGMSIAVVLRIAMALGAREVLNVIGLMFSGGLLLMWVAYRLYRDVTQQKEDNAAESSGQMRANAGRAVRNAVLRIVVADVSMSLDNVLAVAGAAMNNAWVLVIGLLLSIALMGVAANLIAKLLHRHAWISYAGVLVVLYVALRMIRDGAWEIFGAVT